MTGTTNNIPVLSGTWGATKWELYESDQLPDPKLCTAVGCVAIVDLDSQTVAMTRNTRSGGSWEMPAGHIEPGEQPWNALLRETSEEVGFVVDIACIFGYRKIVQPAATSDTPLTAREVTYPPTSYLPYYYAYTEHERTPFSGEDISETKDFTLPELQAMALQGGIRKDELAILQLGLQAAQITNI